MSETPNYVGIAIRSHDGKPPMLVPQIGEGTGTELPEGTRLDVWGPSGDLGDLYLTVDAYPPTGTLIGHIKRANVARLGLRGTAMAFDEDGQRRSSTLRRDDGETLELGDGFAVRVYDEFVESGLPWVRVWVLDARHDPSKCVGAMDRRHLKLPEGQDGEQA